MKFKSRFKYFSGTDEIAHIQPMKNAEYIAKFGIVNGRRYDGYSMMVGKDASGELRNITRVIDYKTNPSLHKCDARCQNAKGRTCECSCGGQYHGHSHSL
jgi:hypothetical protein